MNWRLLITRPEPEASIWVESFNALGWTSCALPLLKINPIPPAHWQDRLIQDLKRAKQVVVVSKPSAHQVLSLLKQHDDFRVAIENVHWFAIGRGTAECLKLAGLNVTYPEDHQTSEGLIKNLQFLKAGQNQGLWLKLGGEGGRHLIATTLRTQGCELIEYALYQRIPIVYEQAEVKNLLQNKGINGVYISSQESLNAWHQLGLESPFATGQCKLLLPSERLVHIATALGYPCAPSLNTMWLNQVIETLMHRDTYA